MATEKQRAYARAYYHRNKEKCKAKVKDWQARNPEYNRLSGAQQRAKKAGVPFALSTEYVASLEKPKICPVLGIPCDGQWELDRIRPSLGYVEGNVRFISKRANRLKADATLEELWSLVADAQLHGN